MRLYFGSAALAWALAACAAVPPPPEADGIAVESIVDAVQCELATAYAHPYSAAIRDWVARTTLSLKVFNEATAAPTVSVSPTLSAGTLTVPFGPDLVDQSTRIVTIVFDVHMRDLQPGHRSRKNRLPPCPSYSGLPQAADGLGLADWIATIAYSAGRPDFASLYGATYDLEFYVKRGVHGGVSFQRATVTVEAAAGTALSKNNNNHLVVTMTEDKKPTMVAGKKKTSDDASERLDLQRSRHLPTRLILQSGSGRLTQ